MILHAEAHHRHPRRVLATVMAALAALLVTAGGASAHPLGNFTVNHSSTIRVAPSAITVDHVLDLAEIPSFQERQGMDADGDGDVSDTEAAAYRDARCASLTDELELQRAGQPLDLRVLESGISFPEGQGALTTRLVCVYGAALEPSLTEEESFTFTDRSFPDRRGWREIIVVGDGATITASDAAAESASERLTSYPDHLLATPPDLSAASFRAAAGGAALPPLDIPDAQPVGGPVEAPVGAAPSAAVPGGIGELGADVTALFQTAELTVPVVLLSLLVAGGLGALHAASPGHGKTVMAAYLVGSRGTLRHAVGLGLTVTISHTIGVLALGALSLSAAAFIAPERLYPILGVVSGAIVIAIGLYLIAARIREARRERRLRSDAAAEHERLHAHGAAHDHEHAPAHGHAHADHGATATGAGHDEHGHDASTDGWHSHGGLRHTHLPPAGAGLSWRGLFALGLAGGMVPSVSALILLLGSISLGRPAYGILLTVAFGLGMAIVLVGVGMALVYARGLVERLPARATSARLTRVLPTATAVVVLGAGLLITTQALFAL